MKQSHYFSHNYYARNDPKLLKIRRKIGMEGVGIFWSLLEMLYEEDGFLPVCEENLETIAFDFRCTLDNLKFIIFECDLFEIEGEKFFSHSVLARIKMKNEKTKNLRENGKKGAEKRWKIANAIQNDSKTMTNAIGSDGKLIAIKEKENKINIKHSFTEGDILNARKNKEKSVLFEKNNFPKDTGGETKSVGQAENTEGKLYEETTQKSVLFEKFFAKFPKKTYEDKAKRVFLKLQKTELAEISKIFPFWLEAWKYTSVDKLPNAYDWLYNRRWREPLPPSVSAENSAENPPKKPKPPRDFFPEIDEKKLETERRERGEILAFFDEKLDSETQAKIAEKARKKLQKSPSKEGDILWQIEIARLTKPIFEQEKNL